MSSNQSDLELYRQAWSGSSTALLVLMGRHGQAILDGLVSSFGDEPLLEDAMQDAWLTAFSTRSGYAGGSFRVWLGTIARRAYVRAQRQATRELIEFDRRSTRRASTRVLIAQLVAAIEVLPNPEQREAAWLYWVDGMSSTEIGRLKSVSRKTVESRLRLARTQLRAMLDADGSQ